MTFPSFDAQWVANRDGIAFDGDYDGRAVRFLITREALGLVTGEQVEGLKGRNAVYLFQDNRERVLPIAHSVWSRLLDPSKTVLIDRSEIVWDPAGEA